VGDWGLTVLSVALLVAGVVVINLARTLAGGLARCGQRRKESKQAEPPESKTESPGAIEGLEAGAAKPDEAPPNTSLGAFAGVPAALVVGISGGSILVPESFVPERLSGLAILPSFGLSAGALGLFVFVAYWVLYKRQPLSLRPGGGLAAELRPDVLIYGIISGCVWNTGNICQIIDLSYLHMPYGLSYPILQCALVVAGLWGIMVFKEVTDRLQVLVFCGGVGLLLVGVVLLGLFGPGSQ